MKKLRLTIYVTIMIAFAGMNCFGQGSSKYKSTKRWQENMQKYTTSDKKNPPPHGAIVCIGSSSMVGWHPTLKEDLAPLTVIPRGFGGSNMNDALWASDKIIIPYKPRAVLVYEGDNDIAQGIEPEKVKDTALKFAKKIHKELPECRIYFLSAKPSIKRWEMWPKMKEANTLLKAECEKDERLTFIDVGAGMLNEDGKPKEEIFKKDKLHMVRDGYIIWRDTVKPVLLKKELEFEKKKE